MRNLTVEEMNLIKVGTNEIIESANLINRNLMISEDETGNPENVVDSISGKSWEYAEVFYN